jgi:hypothetical protein
MKHLLCHTLVRLGILLSKVVVASVEFTLVTLEPAEGLFRGRTHVRFGFYRAMLVSDQQQPRGMPIIVRQRTNPPTT